MASRLAFFVFCYCDQKSEGKDRPREGGNEGIEEAREAGMKEHEGNNIMLVERGENA